MSNEEQIYNEVAVAELDEERWIRVGFDDPFHIASFLERFHYTPLNLEYQDDDEAKEEARLNYRSTSGKLISGSPGYMRNHADYNYQSIETFATAYAIRAYPGLAWYDDGNVPKQYKGVKATRNNVKICPHTRFTVYYDTGFIGLAERGSVVMIQHLVLTGVKQHFHGQIPQHLTIVENQPEMEVRAFIGLRFTYGKTTKEVDWKPQAWVPRTGYETEQEAHYDLVTNKYGTMFMCRTTVTRIKLT